MNKVTTINLNGNAYQLEEPGYEKLTAYLSGAKARLAGNPDQDEIVSDLEQAIADKLRRFLSGHKSVITAEEVATVIEEMGPVGVETPDGAPAAPKTKAPKRIYRIKEGAMIGGVANGLAAYLDIDVTIVRIVFLVLGLFTSGVFIFAYLVAWIIIPPAVTDADFAALSGSAFTAEELINRAKSEYARLDGTRAEWKREWKQWRKRMKQERRAYHAQEHRDRYEYRYRHSTAGELLRLIVLIFLLWLAYHHIPVAHEFMDAAWRVWLHAADRIAAALG